MTDEQEAPVKRKGMGRSPRPPGSVPAYVPDNPLLTAKEAAAERKQGLSTFYRDVKRGLIAPPIYVSPRCPRWPRNTIRPDLAQAGQVAAEAR